MEVDEILEAAARKAMGEWYRHDPLLPWSAVPEKDRSLFTWIQVLKMDLPEDVRCTVAVELGIKLETEFRCTLEAEFRVIPPF